MFCKEKKTEEVGGNKQRDERYEERQNKDGRIKTKLRVK